MPKDKIMVVALVILPGKNTAGKMRNQILRGMHLIKTVIHAALDDFDDLTINIGRQGGSEKYQSALINELQAIPEYFIERKLFKKAKFSLLSSNNPGIQLADFYASASRNYFLARSASVSAAPYMKVAHQMVQLPELEH